MAQLVTNPPAMQNTWVQPLGLGTSPFQYACLENPHGQRRLVGYSPRGHKESDMTEQLSTAHGVALRLGRPSEKKPGSTADLGTWASTWLGPGRGGVAWFAVLCQG